MRSVTLYTRPGCHLCDEAREAILGLRDVVPPFELDEVNIDRDDALLARYVERIPVVVVDGDVISELELELDSLRAALLVAGPGVQGRAKTEPGEGAGSEAC